MLNIFTYGSLMCRDIMFKVAGCRLGFSQATLTNFLRSKIRDEEYPGIVPQRGSVVTGIIYFDLSAESINRLDIFEGELYRRQKVEVITENNSSVAAMTYVIKPRYEDLLTGEEWSFSEFLAIGKKKFEESYTGFQDVLP